MYLRLYFSESWFDSASNCPWVLCDDSGSVVEGGFSTISTLPKANYAVAIIAASRITCASVAMPTQSRRRWEAALPFVAEEFTLTEPEHNHVVPGPVQKDGLRSLFILDKVWLKSIVLACQAAGVNLRKVVPEVLLPSLPPASWTAVWNGRQGFLRTGMASGLALDGGDEQHSPLALTMTLNSSQSSLPQNIVLHFTSDLAESDRHLPNWELPVTMTLGEPWDWRSASIPNDALNLLWGDLAPRAKLQEWLPKLKPVALILFTALTIETIGVNLEWLKLSQGKAAATQEMERTFRKAFGDSSTMVNPSLQMQRNIATLRHTVGQQDEADFLPLLDQFSNALSSFPSKNITNSHYDSGRLDVALKLSSNSDLQKLQQRLVASGLSVRISDEKSSSGAVEAKLVIQLGGTL